MSLQLRPYQAQAVRCVRECLATYDSCLMEAATGTGKTVTFAHLAKDWPGRVLIVAHREELVRQAADKVLAVTGSEPGVEMAGDRVDEGPEPEGRPKVVVGSVQTLGVGGRVGKFRPHEFGLLVIDEAHHAVAASYRKVIDHFAPAAGQRHCKVLGVTATPRRADDVALGQVFQQVAYRYGILQAVEDGWLVPVSQQAVKVDGLDFSKVRSVADDFNEADLEKVLVEEEILHKVAAPTADACAGRPALVFCCTVQHAKLMAAVLKRYSGSAAFLCGASDREEKADTLAEFRAGRLNFLCNCALYLEGFDAPATAAVVMARPTKSPLLYAQVLGRGTRPLPGTVDGLESAGGRRAAIAASAKPGMLALDFVGNSGRHKIVTAGDVLGGKFGTPVREYARQTVAQEQRAVPVQEALGRARAELDLLAEEERRRRRITARADYRTEAVSPFDRAHAPAPTGRVFHGDPATDKQVNYLAYLGVPRDTARTYTRRQASAVIDKLVRQREGA